MTGGRGVGMKAEFHAQYVWSPFDLRLTIGDSAFDLRLILKQ
ncbi:hypothetical protein RESH_04969 [Rhodopirellula europaea SH398]|uniref:Uncharacterized protein n=1 Tax=Rhodopirellula europaea SH398 TaxID=1263868 RepID=M5RZ16_9BACT|nr:hypothetical protein RESH_04969 [Rhodopirellula europaea SH398]